MLGLERAVDRDTEIVRLFLRQLRKLDADFVQMQARDFFVEFFWQDVNADFRCRGFSTDPIGPGPDWKMNST
jgi:hypothetical protein